MSKSLLTFLAVAQLPDRHPGSMESRAVRVHLSPTGPSGWPSPFWPGASLGAGAHIRCLPCVCACPLDACTSTGLTHRMQEKGKRGQPSSPECREGAHKPVLESTKVV